MNLLLPLLLALLSACTHAPSARGPASPPRAAEFREEFQATGSTYAIASQGRHASEAGARIFEAGGNAIDAAVAVSFAISVERPHSTGIGGGGFLLFREARTGKVHAADFRERAPLLATRDMMLDPAGRFVPERSLNGILSVGTPGLVAGLVEVHRKWGKLPLAKVLEPAIEIAEQGFDVTAPVAEALAFRRDVIAQDPAASAIFLKPGGVPYAVGEKLVQKDLGRTLRLIAAHGRAGFYAGPVAASIAATSARLHGLLRQKDLDAYRVKWREPLRGSWRGLELYSMPPPSSGGIHVLQILNMLENDPLRELGFLSPEAIHRTAAAMQLAYADRATYPGDPDFVRVPTDWLISKDYAARRRALIEPGVAKPSAQVRAGDPPPGWASGPARDTRAESPETTHFSIMDAEGNAVASTQTINFAFGSGVVAAGSGVLLNDEMDDFSGKPGAANAFGALGGDANAIAPGKTPLSSMSPTILLRDGVPVMTVGAPGGTRIITCVTQTILNYYAYGLSPFDSVASVRVHHQWNPDRLDLEAPGPGEETVRALERMGYTVGTRLGAVPCKVEMVVRENGTLTAISDPRDSSRSLAK